MATPVFVQLPDDSGNTGKKIDNNSFSRNAQTVFRQITNLGDSEAGGEERLARVLDSAPTTEAGVVTRNIPSGNQTISGTVTVTSLQTDALTNTELRAALVPVSVDNAVGSPANVQIGDGTDVALVNPSGELLVDEPNLISTNNSTTATLGISGNFTGTGDDVSDYSAVTIQLDASHDSATDGMTFEFSTDNTNWDDIHTFTYTAADGARHFQFPATAEFFRVNYTNGGTGQTHFRVQSILHRHAVASTIHRLGEDEDPDHSATLNKSVMMAQINGSGDFTPIQSDASGNFKIDLEDIAGNAIAVDQGIATTGTQRVTVATDDSVTVDATNDGSLVTQLGDGTALATIRDLAANDALNVAIVDAAGDHITSFGGGTQYTEGATAATDPIGTAQNLVAQITPALEVLNGENVAQRSTRYGAAYTQILDSSGNFIDTFGGSGGTAQADNTALGSLTGTGYLLDATPPTITDGNVGMPRMDSNRFPMVIAQANDGVDIGDVTINNLVTTPIFAQPTDGTTAYDLPPRATDAAAHGASQLGVRAMGSDGTNDQQVLVDGTGRLQADVLDTTVGTNTTDIPNVIGTDGTAGPTSVLSIGGTQAGGNIQELLVDASGRPQIDIAVQSLATLTVTDDGSFNATVDAPATTPVATRPSDGAAFYDLPPEAIDGAAHGASQLGVRVLGSDGTNDEQILVSSTGRIQADVLDTTVGTNTTDIPNVIGTDGTGGPTNVLSMGGTESGGNIQELRVDANGELQVDLVNTAGTNPVPVQGDTTVDVAVTGNPVLLGAEAETPDDSDPGSVSADADAVRLGADRNGILYVNTFHPRTWHVSAEQTTAVTDTTVKAAPGSGLSLYITDILLSCDGATDVLFEEGTSTQKFKHYSDGQGSGFTWHAQQPMKITGNTLFSVSSSIAVDISYTVSGFTAP